MPVQDMQEALHLSHGDSKPNPFARLRAAFSRGGSEQHASASSYTTDPVAPEAIRYALEYKGANFGRKEIVSLSRNGFLDLTTYSLLKSLNGIPDQQQALMEGIVDSVVDDPTHARDRIHALHEDILDSPATAVLPEIKGAKAAQIIRQGISLWDGKFTELAQRINQMPQGVVPVYIGYAGALGLRQAIEEFSKTGRDMMFLIPDWVKSLESSNAGYAIDFDAPTGERVSELPKNFERPEEFVFVDDTRRNGASAQVMWDYWTHNSGQPLSEDRLRIVDFAPKNAAV
ncbi:MAG: hypothetical protein HZC02_05495 [Candidatus Levybacteria bacterium]|nr:hypothetical protein [Candidatus Levybacteria bacterium]